MSDLYQELCNMLIRPTRQVYHLYDLGNPAVSTYGKRQDFQIISRQTMKVKCSFYCCTNNVKPQMNPLPTVIYLHSLNGSRLQFLSNIEPLLKLGFCIATLDFVGCGLSDGNYVTLGAHEKWDVLQLVKYVYRTYNKTNFVIWGRSMGAVAAIKFCTLFQQQKEKSKQLKIIKVLALVLDSPFSSLNQLAIQIAKNRINIPEIVIKMAFYMIQNSIESKANFKTSELQLQNQVKKISTSTLIITSKKDTLVPYEHSLTIYNNISSNDKQLMYIETEHNNNRQEKDIDKIYQFLKQKSLTFFKKSMFRTGSLEKKLEKLKAKSLKKQEISTESKQKLNRYQSQKNQIYISSSKNFSHSVVGKDYPISIQQEQQNLTFPIRRRKEFSVEKIIPESKNEETEVPENVKSLKPQFSQNRNYFSADRPRVFFINEILQNNSGNSISFKKSNQKKVDGRSSIFISTAEARKTQKPLNHSLSYKNIQCLKTVKKIRRLEPEFQNIELGQKQKDQTCKNHMNVITSKLKKKSKNGLTKSFLPHPIVQIKNQDCLQIEKSLKKEINAKSSTILELTNNKRSPINNEFQNYPQNMSHEKPSTPACFSNRQIFFSEKIPKPFTPQFPLHSSMRINEIQQRRETSKEDILKMYSMQPIAESNKGIKTSLHSKYISNDQNRNNGMIQSVGQRAESLQRPQFMSCKNMLSSQIISMRAQPLSSNKSRKYIFMDKLHPSQQEEETSITLS